MGAKKRSVLTGIIVGLLVGILALAVVYVIPLAMFGYGLTIEAVTEPDGPIRAIYPVDKSHNK